MSGADVPEPLVHDKNVVPDLSVYVIISSSIVNRTSSIKNEVL